jgi:ketosteroid isomerase-like protein
MDPISVFVNYALRFEQAFASGDWSALAACFRRDGVLEIGGGPPFGGRHVGRAAIADYYARVTRAFDRRFDERDLALVEGPLERDGGIWARWSGAYRVAGAPDLPLEGEFFATTRDGEIARYEERIADGTWRRVAAWLEAHGAKLAPAAAQGPEGA